MALYKCIDEDLCQNCYHAFLSEGKHHDTDHIFIPQNAGGTVKSTSTDPGKRLDWEPYSVPHLAKDPVYVPDVELPNEDIMSLLEHPAKMGVVRVFLDPVAHQLAGSTPPWWLCKELLPVQGPLEVSKSKEPAGTSYGWWRNGLDNCASLKNPTECWISKQAQPTGDKVQSIQEALASQASNEKDLPAAGDSELEMIYLDGSEVGLLGIHRLVREGKAILRSGDGSTTGQDMSAGVYRAEDGKDLYVKVGRANEGTSSTRPETGALLLALTDTRDRNKALIYIGDSSTLLTNAAAYVGEGKGKSLAQYRSG